MIGDKTSLLLPVILAIPERKSVAPLLHYDVA
jgi:hypothetical protein